MHQIDADNDGSLIDESWFTLNNIGDPNDTTTFIMSTNLLKFSSAASGWAGISIENTNASISGETTLWSLGFTNEADDANMTWFNFYDSGGTVFKMTGVAGGAQITAGAGGTTKLYASEVDFDLAANLKVAGSQIDHNDMAGAADINTTGTIKGALAVYAAADITSDTFVGQEDALRGTLVTNEGDGDGETWELPVCTSPTAGFSAKILCAAAETIELDAGSASTIYVSDGTDIVNAEVDDDSV
ncbi:unnamed protein product, partial [marine sediment metagenome]